MSHGVRQLRCRRTASHIRRRLSQKSFPAVNTSAVGAPWPPCPPPSAPQHGVGEIGRRTINSKLVVQSAASTCPFSALSSAGTKDGRAESSEVLSVNCVEKCRPGHVPALVLQQQLPCANHALHLSRRISVADGRFSKRVEQPTARRAAL